MSLFVEYGSPFPVWLFDYPFCGRRGPMNVEKNELPLTGDLIRDLYDFQHNFDECYDAFAGWKTPGEERSYHEQGARLLLDLQTQTRHLGLMVVSKY
ncbi:hypothetical protein [Rhodococcus sp. NBC_00297]|uniref:hypothetical protein n=1 Tax=Rhodococcus sp. NBC_00297 TaxID=2976005 RepID=UPI002E2B6E87|nr:hypothetical protein [Rhodococcus sp. NBC_00297]